MASGGKIAGITCQFAKSWAVVLLLFLYVVASSNVESLHSLFHEDEATVLHTTQTESDPCHVRLYHQDRSGGCGHDSHLVNEVKCSLCDARLHAVQLVENCAIALPLTFCIASSHDSFELRIEGINFQSPGRAPPVS